MNFNRQDAVGTCIVPLMRPFSNTFVLSFKLWMRNDVVLSLKRFFINLNKNMPVKAEYFFLIMKGVFQKRQRHLTQAICQLGFCESILLDRCMTLVPCTISGIWCFSFLVSLKKNKETVFFESLLIRRFWSSDNFGSKCLFLYWKLLTLWRHDGFFFLFANQWCT